MALVRVDATDYTAVAVCKVCGWRSLQLSRIAAWSIGADHERTAHGEGQRGAVDYLARLRQRAAAGQNG